MKTKYNKNVCIADYISCVNCNNEPIGHAKKILIENCQWLKNKYNITCAASKEYIKDLKEIKSKKLPFRVVEGKNYNYFCGKIIKLFISWINIIYCFSCKGYVWFDNVDILLIIYLFFHPIKCKRTIISLYTNSFEKKYHNYMFLCVTKRVKLFISSSKVNIVPNSFYLPDYLYKDDIYIKYKSNIKVNDFICLGVMSEDKELEKLIQIFRGRKEKLLIIGHFINREWFLKLQQIAGNNVEVVDTYLEYDMYLGLLSKSRFCILPYKKEVYENKTSGVAIESIFLNTVPVSLKTLIRNWDIEGIGYDEIENLWKQDMSEERINVIKNSNSRVITEKYNADVYLKKIINELE